ncbi:MAG: hypothetical protein AB1486_09315 [Planctomycetota bacterium]
MSLPHLLIDDVSGEIVHALRAHGAIVIVAPPGAGKTTRVPPALLHAGFADTGRTPKGSTASSAATKPAAVTCPTPGVVVRHRPTGSSAKIRVITWSHQRI